MNPSFQFSTGGDNSFRGVMGGRRTCLLQRMARTGRRQPARRSGRASRRGASDAWQPRSSRTRIRTEGRPRQRVGGAAAGARARARADHAGARGPGRRAARPPDRHADGDRKVPAPRRRPIGRARPAARTWPDPQGHQAGQCSRRSRDRPGLADRLWHRFAPSARAPGARTSRVHRRNARLHGARADRTNESLDRFPQRSLLTRRHALRNADRQSSLHGFRSDGMGALPHRKTAGAAQRAVEEMSRARLCNHHEAARQDGRGALPDGGGRRERSSALSCRMGSRRAASTNSRSASTTRRTGC